MWSRGVAYLAVLLLSLNREASHASLSPPFISVTFSAFSSTNHLWRDFLPTQLLLFVLPLLLLPFPLLWVCGLKGVERLVALLSLPCLGNSSLQYSPSVLQWVSLSLFFSSSFTSLFSAFTGKESR